MATHWEQNYINQWTRKNIQTIQEFVLLSIHKMELKVQRELPAGPCVLCSAFVHKQRHRGQQHTAIICDCMCAWATFGRPLSLYYSYLAVAVVVIAVVVVAYSVYSAQCIFRSHLKKDKNTKKQHKVTQQSYNKLRAYTTIQCQQQHSNSQRGTDTNARRAHTCDNEKIHHRQPYVNQCQK